MKEKPDLVFQDYYVILTPFLLDWSCLFRLILFQSGHCTRAGPNGQVMKSINCIYSGHPSYQIKCL